MNLTDNEKIVHSTIKKYPVVSCPVLSYYLQFKQNVVQSCLDNLLSLRKIYRSVGGVPERYSSYGMEFPN